MSGKYSAMFANPLTIKQLFQECLAPFTKPPRNFYENIFRYATDPAEKAQLKEILTKENKPQLKEWTANETVTCMGVIRKFPSIKITLEQMLDLLPVYKPRYYSIASSQKVVGLQALHLCIGVVEWKTSSGEKRKGEMTDGISRWRPEHGKVLLNGSIKPTAFNLPPSDTNPIIVAGMGTGIAPFRAFVQHRGMLSANKKPCGPVSVYFGCRYKAKDFLYEKEWMEGVEKGYITELELAFSRDTSKKDYIQHHIVKNGANFYKRMHDEDGYFYLCGSAKQVPIDVMAAVKTVVMEHGQKTEAEASEMINGWILKGKYNVEAW